MKGRARVLPSRWRATRRSALGAASSESLWIAIPRFIWPKVREVQAPTGAWGMAVNGADMRGILEEGADGDRGVGL